MYAVQWVKRRVRGFFVFTKQLEDVVTQSFTHAEREFDLSLHFPFREIFWRTQHVNLSAIFRNILLTTYSLCSSPANFILFLYSSFTFRAWVNVYEIWSLSIFKEKYIINKKLINIEEELARKYDDWSGCSYFNACQCTYVIVYTLPKCNTNDNL